MRAMKLVTNGPMSYRRRRRHAIAAALGGRAGMGKVVAVVSGGNIDLSKFASLVGACDAAQSSIVNQ
jgi:hypothetical protein